MLLLPLYGHLGKKVGKFTVMFRKKKVKPDLNQVNSIRIEKHFVAMKKYKDVQ